MKTKYFTPKRMAKIAVLSALATVLMFLEFPLPIAPSFYKMDFSELPVLIGGFALGPLSAVIIELLKIVINTLFTGTSTAYVGELANFIIGCALCVPAAWVYRKQADYEGLLKGLVVGGLSMTIVGFMLNLWVVIPAYVFLAHYPLDAIIDLGKAIFPIIDSVFMLVLCCTTPFNLIKAFSLSLVCVLFYKRIEKLMK